MSEESAASSAVETCPTCGGRGYFVANGMEYDCGTCAAGEAYASGATRTARRLCGHTEHTIGFTGRFLGRSPLVEGYRDGTGQPLTHTPWEPCTTGPHHEHQVGHGDYADVECCICPGTPCGDVTVADMRAHREYDRKQERASGLVDARFAISAAITAALDDVPEGSLDQAAENAWRTCWLIARGDVDEPPF